MKKDIIGTAPEERFDVLTKEASERLTCPISTVSIIDNDREWYKSVVGLNEKQAPIAASFCVHAMKAKSVFLVEDTLNDPRFVNNPMVVNPP
ncbi:MAG: GAF domain-containing protein, partial [Patescibacteria group bacterium]|nr:GAF domain-containing protein [Patescibacteria group bacterium]